MGVPVKLLLVALLATGMQVWEGSLGQTLGQAQSPMTSPQYAFIAETSSWSQPIYFLLAQVMESCERTTALVNMPTLQPWIKMFCSAMQPHCADVTRSATLSSTCQVRAVAAVVHSLCQCGRKSNAWSDWSEWGQCACAGGSGVKSRFRTCLSEGEACIGSAMETAACDYLQCPAPQCSKAVFPKIIGGMPASECEFPYLVAFHYNKDVPACAGFIINSTTILTAAHCVHMKGEFVVHAGKYRTSASEDSASQQLQVVAVAGHTIHPSYNSLTLHNDIALVTLKTALRWTRCVQPACLPELQEKPDLSEDCFSAGWGATLNTAYNPPRPTVLMKVQLKGYGLQQCRAAFPLIGNRANYLPTAGLCAAGPGRDTCQGDSGGPLLCKSSSGLYKAFGIVSNGIECALPDYPGIYTDVAYYMNFVRKSL